MKQLRRVVWSEGMYLAPQHFQTQGRYLEDSLAFAVSSLWFRPYGLLALELDSEAIAAGTAALVRCKGVLPDGLTFDLPDSDPQPAALAFRDKFLPTNDSHVLYLAIPNRQDGLPNVADSGTATRYVASTQLRCDETTGAEERLVGVAQKNFRLLLDTELSPKFAALPIARIVRAAGEKFAFDHGFIPPLLDIAASPRLIHLLRDLVGSLDQLSQDVTQEQRASGQAAAEYWRRELTSFWLLHTVHSSLTLLRHLLLAKHGHPEILFRELSRLAGALCSFKLNSHPRDLPLYDHDRLSECFQTLERHIRGHLELVEPKNVAYLDFQASDSYFWTLTVADQRLLDRTRWLLEIRARTGEAGLISGVPKLVKVCAERYIRELVNRAVDGLPLTHLPLPPPGVRDKVDAHYFSISKSGPCWDAIVKRRQVGLYVPGDFPSPEVRLIVVMEE